MRDPSTETEKLLLEQLYGYVMIVLTVEPAESPISPLIQPASIVSMATAAAATRRLYECNDAQKEKARAHA